ELVEEFARRYGRIGWSPLVRITVAQAEALERELGADFRVAAGMRFSLPTIAEAVEVLAAAGAERLVGICLSPQWSPLLMGGYARALEEAVAALARPVPFAVAGAWHREPAFVDALAERVREALGRLGPDADRVPVLLTAHSLPKRVFESEPDYVAQLRETGELVAARAGLAPERWRWAYQSAGHTAEEWLRPDLKELFPSLVAEGHRDVLVAPVQFLSDHLEVLYDLDVAAAKEAASSGLRYHRIEMPNTQPAFIRALAAVVRTESGGATGPRPALARRAR
ncbi:MAG: ferrochelatase, partial [Candidatus Limnocylindria bacterium]